MIDQGSSDGSAGIAVLEAPSHWHLQTVGTELNPENIALAESKAPEGSWRMTLTPSDFLIHTDLRSMLSGFGEDSKLLRFKSFTLSGGDAPPEKKYLPVLLQRTKYLVEKITNKSLDMPFRDGKGPSSLFLHRVTGLSYSKDRLNVGSKFVPAKGVEFVKSGFIAFLGGTKGAASSDLAEVDLRTTYATVQLAERLGITTSMRSAHAAWYEIFHGDMQLVFETDLKGNKESVLGIQQDTTPDL